MIGLAGAVRKASRRPHLGIFPGFGAVSVNCGWMEGRRIDGRIEGLWEDTEVADIFPVPFSSCSPEVLSAPNPMSTSLGHFCFSYKTLSDQSMESPQPKPTFPQDKILCQISLKGQWKLMQL